MKIILSVLALAILFPAHARAQSTQASPTPESDYSRSRVLGEVLTVDKGKQQLVIKTQAGQSVVAVLDKQTAYRRIPPGATSLDKAVNISLDEVDIGDKVIARGKVSPEAVQARELIVISKLELAERVARARAEWVRRGIIGTITALNSEKKEITLRARTDEGDKTVVVDGSKGRFLRYAPDSVRYRDAQESSFTALKVGDQLRALGEKSADGTHFTPEEIVSGTFATTAGKITAVNPQTGELSVTIVPAAKPITVVINNDSKVRRLPQELVKKWEKRITDRTAPAPGERGEDIQNSIDGLPSIAITDLKPGDAVVVSSTVGTNATRLTAITIAAGVDSWIKRLQEKNQRVLNLDLGLPAGVSP